MQAYENNKCKKTYNIKYKISVNRPYYETKRNIYIK